MAINDVHCHFFSTPFFRALGRQLPDADPEAPETTAIRQLGWDPPGSAEDLSDRWAAELDMAGVARAVLIASVPGDAGSVATALGRHPGRFVGWFMVDPNQPDAAARAAEALDRNGLRGLCLFPAMHRVAISDPRIRVFFEMAAARRGVSVFVHCGLLTVGVRAKLGLASPFDLSLGNPAELRALADSHPETPIVIPHFGAGRFDEALALARACRNVYLDTSSSNSWIAQFPGLTLPGVFERALEAAGAERLLFGSDSSFFPRGWVREVYEQQSAVLDELAVGDDVKAKIVGGNFDRLFPRTWD